MVAPRGASGRSLGPHAAYQVGAGRAASERNALSKVSWSDFRYEVLGAAKRERMGRMAAPAAHKKRGKAIYLNSGSLNHRHSPSVSLYFFDTRDNGDS